MSDRQRSAANLLDNLSGLFRRFQTAVVGEYFGPVAASRRSGAGAGGFLCRPSDAPQEGARPSLAFNGFVEAFASLAHAHLQGFAPDAPGCAAGLRGPIAFPFEAMQRFRASNSAAD
jgi:hypothetical protein